MAPYIVIDGSARRRAVVEFVDAGALFAVLWREARAWLLLFVDAMADDWILVF